MGGGVRIKWVWAFQWTYWLKYNTTEKKQGTSIYLYITGLILLENQTLHTK